MKTAGFQLHPHSHHEALWGGLLVLIAFLLVVVLATMATLYGWQLPSVQPLWGGDFFKLVPTPLGPY